MAGSLYRGKDWSSSRNEAGFGRIERVTTQTFCDIGHCTNLAVWRIGYDAQSVDFCSKHTLRVMRDQRLWRGTPERPV